MHSFRIQPGAYKIVRKKILLWTLPAIVIVFGTLIITNIGNYKEPASVTLQRLNGTYAPDATDIAILLLPFAIGISVASFGFFRSMRRVKLLFNSYELSITDNLISREQANTPTISLPE